MAYDTFSLFCSIFKPRLSRSYTSKSQGRLDVGKRGCDIESAGNGMARRWSKREEQRVGAPSSCVFSLVGESTVFRSLADCFHVMRPIPSIIAQARI